VNTGLEAAIPSMPQWKHASLPVHLTIDETERVLGAALDSSPHELSNHAIVLILARMGLRACEVRHLTLDDINWAEGCVGIAPGKHTQPHPTSRGKGKRQSHRERDR
jgi:integrase/recombinase XerD